MAYKFKPLKPSGSLKCSEDGLLRVGSCCEGTLESFDCGSSTAMNSTSAENAAGLGVPPTLATTLWVLCGFLKQLFPVNSFPANTQQSDNVNQLTENHYINCHKFAAVEYWAADKKVQQTRI